MKKTILITGSTDGIGKLTATLLAARGHNVLVHGRSVDKLRAVAAEIGGDIETYAADLSAADAVRDLASQIRERHERLDVLINNAGVFKTGRPKTADGLDVRFVVNVLAPYLLTHALLPLLPEDGRIVNLSSAAQAPVNVDAMAGRVELDDMGAYAQSKLAITIWSAGLAQELPGGPSVVAVNPGSLLASKMVREGFGVAGKDLRIGADVLVAAALDEGWANPGGKYYDNDARRFSPPHPAGLDATHVKAVLEGIRAVAASL